MSRVRSRVFSTCERGGCRPGAASARRTGRAKVNVWMRAGRNDFAGEAGMSRLGWTARHPYLESGLFCEWKIRCAVGCDAAVRGTNESRGRIAFQ